MAFDGLTMFVDLVVVDVGSIPITSTAVWTLAMLAIVVHSSDSCKVRAPLYTVILLSEMVRVCSASIDLVHEPEQ